MASFPVSTASFFCMLKKNTCKKIKLAVEIGKEARSVYLLCSFSAEYWKSRSHKRQERTATAISLRYGHINGRYDVMGEK